MSGETRRRLKNELSVALESCARRRCSTTFWGGYRIDGDDRRSFLSVVAFEETTDVPERVYQWKNEADEGFNIPHTSNRTCSEREETGGNIRMTARGRGSGGVQGDIEAGGTARRESRVTHEQQHRGMTYPANTRGEHRSGGRLRIIKYKAQVRANIEIRVYPLKNMKVGAGVSSGVGATAGTAGGVTAGVVIGALAGSVVPVFGTIIGGIAGGVIGAFGGAAAGTVAGGAAGTGIGAAVSYNKQVIITAKEVLQELPNFEYDNKLNCVSCTVQIDRQSDEENLRASPCT